MCNYAERSDYHKIPKGDDFVRNMRQNRMLVVVAALAIVLVSAFGVAAQRQFVTIATGGVAGVYFPLGGAMAEILNANVDGVSATAQSTGASVANVGLIQQGEVELALIQNDIAFYAATGTEMFSNANTKLQGIAVLYPETVQVVVRADSGIRTIEDLAGRRVVVGDRGSGTEANARQILAAHGMTYDDLGRVDYLSFAEGANNLRDRNVDAVFNTAGTPTAAISEIASTHDINILSVSTDAFTALAADYPFYTQVTIPGGTYQGLDEDVSTVAVMAMLAVNADLSEQLVYDMTASMFGNLDRIASAHAQGAHVSLEGALDGMPLEVHPGAAKFFDEN